jgi:hypothetical protein
VSLIASRAIQANARATNRTAHLRKISAMNKPSAAAAAGNMEAHHGQSITLLIGPSFSVNVFWFGLYDLDQLLLRDIPSCGALFSDYIRRTRWCDNSHRRNNQ